MFCTQFKRLSRLFLERRSGGQKIPSAIVCLGSIETELLCTDLGVSWSRWEPCPVWLRRIPKGCDQKFQDLSLIACSFFPLVCYFPFLYSLSWVHPVESFESFQLTNPAYTGENANKVCKMELYLLWIHLKECNSNYFTGRKPKPEKLQGLFNIPQQIPNYCTRKKKNAEGSGHWVTNG